MFWRRMISWSGNDSAPPRFTEEELRRAIELLYVPGDDRERLSLLRKAGDQAVPLLLSTLDDPRTTSTRFDEGKPFSLLPKTPFARIWELLKRTSLPGTAVGPLKKLLDHEDSDVRKHAASLLGFMAAVPCVEPVRKALADEENYVRTFAMIGMLHAMQANRGDPVFFRGIFDSLANLLDWYDESISGTAPTLLLAIDRKKALAIMLSPRYFSVENRAMQFVLRALNGIRYPIPHATLLPLLRQARERQDERHCDLVYADALRAYALHPDAATRALLLAERESPNSWIRAAASESLAKLDSERR